MKIGADPPDLNKYDSYEDFRNNVLLWQGFSDFKKNQMGAMLAYALPNKSLVHGDLIQKDLFCVHPVEDLLDDENGVKVVIKFLDGHIGKKTRESELDAFDKIWSYRRTSDQSILEYLRDHERFYNCCKTLGITFTDTCSAFICLLGARLNATQAELVKAVIDIEKESKSKTMYTAVKTKMRDMLSNSLGNISSGDAHKTSAEAFIAENQEAYANWQKKGSYKKNYTTNYNKSYNNNNNNKKYANNGNRASYPSNKTDRDVNKMNPLDPRTGKPLKCKTCGSFRHFNRDCSYNKDNSGVSFGRKKGRVYLVNVEDSDEEQALLSQFDKVISEDEEEEGKEETDQDQTEKVFFTTNKEELSKFTAESINCAALDSCCTSSVSGHKWMEIYLASAPGEIKKLIKGPYESKKTFQFGNQGILPTSMAYTIPIIVAGQQHLIEVDVIDSDIPLLMSKAHMKKLGITLNMANDTASINGKQIRVDTTSAGHFILNLFGDNEHQDTELMQEIHAVNMLEENEEVQIRMLNKLHKQFGHRPKRVFVELIKSAEQWDPKFSKMIDKIIDACEGCILRKRNPDKPAVALPMAKDFNHILSMDLKQWDNKCYILYFVDMFTRYTVGTVIKDKKPDTIIAKLFDDWIRYFTAPDMILTDNGGEFVNEAMKESCSVLNIYHATTAAYSPWQNGTCEKNHALNDCVISSLLRDYPKMPLEQAVAWSCAVKNSLTNVYGYSSFELTFGRAPRLPNIMSNPIPASQITPRSEALIKNISTIQNTREAFAKAEKCQKLKLALSLKMRAANHDYKSGDLVYYKRDKDDKWLGPAKVIFQDSKVIGIRTTTGYVRVSANRLWPAGETLSQRLRDEESQWEKIRMKNKVDSDKKQNNAEKPIFKSEESSEDEDFQEAVEEANTETTEDGGNNDNENTLEQDATEEAEPADQASKDNNILSKHTKFKVNERIEYKLDGKWERGVVIGLAGKKGGRHKNWYNVRLDKGKEFSANFDKTEVRPESHEDVDEEALTIQDILDHSQLEDDTNEGYNVRLDNGKVLTIGEKQGDITSLDEEQAFATWAHEEILAVMLPKERRNTPECDKAKEEELEKLKSFETYTEVDDEGQNRITTTWVLTLKGLDVKARLTARGFQESDEYPKESPTLQKYSLRTLLTIATAKGWTIETVDVKSAFLQGTQLTRQVFVQPPKESNTPNKLWLLNKCLYGLRDASRQWYTKVENVLLNLGFEKCTYDSGLFFLMKDGKLEALVGLHVDDFLNAGGKYFHEAILPEILKTFKVGKSEQGNFMYTGFQLSQDAKGVLLDQSEYVESITIPTLDAARMRQLKEDMTFEELSLLRKMTGQLNWTVRSTRPDLSFNMIACSTHFKGGTVADLKYAKKTLSNLQQNKAVLRFSNLGELSKTEIWLFTDASYGNLNEGTDSTQGYVIFLVNPSNGKCSPIDWRANKINRVVTSTLAAEALSLTKGLDAAVAFKWTLQQLLGKEGDIPVRAIVDNKDTFDSVNSTTDVQERKLRREIGVIKQMLIAKELNYLVWVRGAFQLADPLTKLGANGDMLIQVMQEGKIPDEYMRAILST